MEISLPPSFLRIEESISFTEMDLQVYTKSCNRKCHKFAKCFYVVKRAISSHITAHKKRNDLIIFQSNLGGYLGLYLGVSLVQVIDSILVLIGNLKETYRIDEKCDFSLTMFSCYSFLVGRRFQNGGGLFLLLKEKRIGKGNKFGAGIHKKSCV